MPLFAHSDNHVGLQVADLLASTLVFPMAAAAYGAPEGNVHASFRTRPCAPITVTCSVTCSTGTPTGAVAGGAASSSATRAVTDLVRCCSARRIGKKTSSGT